VQHHTNRSRNYYGETPQDAARGEVLQMLEALAQAEEDHNPYAETSSFNTAKRKQFARLYYKLAHQWGFDYSVTLET
tara:strand:+ start:174 stop:404 length:231 start_codon:yes stop_codon:yes gene_type:complete